MNFSTDLTKLKRMANLAAREEIMIVIEEVQKEVEEEEEANLTEELAKVEVEVTKPAFLKTKKRPTTSLINN